MARYYLVVTLWGAEFRGYFLDLCLASLLAPGNAPALRSGGDDARLLICTTRADWDEIQKDATFQRATEFLTPEFLELRMPVPAFLRPPLVERRRRLGLPFRPARRIGRRSVSSRATFSIALPSVNWKSIAAAVNAPLPPHSDYDLRIMFMTWGHKLGAERAFRERCNIVFLGADMMFADGAFRELSAASTQVKGSFSPSPCGSIRSVVSRFCARQICWLRARRFR